MIISTPQLRRSTGIPYCEGIPGGGLVPNCGYPLADAPDGETRLDCRIAADLGLGIRSLQIDKLRGPGFKSGRHRMRIKANGISVFTHRIEHITSKSLKATDLGVTPLADTSMLLRHAEIAGRATRIVGCLKKVIGNFESALRALKVGPSGINISEQLRRLQQTLTRMPVFACD